MEFDAVIVHGGVGCPDKLRRHKEVLDIVKKMNENRKIIAAICPGPWMMISAGVVKGGEATSFFAIRDDMINAGANYKDQSVVVDGNLVTSRDPDSYSRCSRDSVVGARNWVVSHSYFYLPKERALLVSWSPYLSQYH